MPDKKIILERSYNIKVITYSDGTGSMTRHCDGFDAHELLGLLERIQFEIFEQIKGNLKPIEVKREVVKGAIERARKVKSKIKIY